MKQTRLLGNMRHFLIFFVLASFIVSGCQNSASATKSDKDTSTLAPPDSGSASAKVVDGSVSTDINSPSNPNSSAKPNTNPPGVPESAKGAPTMDDKGKPVTPSPASVPISPPQTGNWTKSTLAAPAIAKNVAQRIAKLDRARSTAQLFVKVPTGNGQLNLESFFGGTKGYQIAYGFTAERPFYCSVQSDGKQKLLVLKESITKPLPNGKPDVSTTNLRKNVLTAFPLEFNRGVFAILTDGWDALGTFITAANKPNSGFEIITEERITPYQGMNIVNYRILVRRTASAAKKLGKSETEIVIDKVHWLPVTIRSQVAQSDGKMLDQLWSSKWEFNVKIDPKMFDLNPKTQPSLKAEAF